MIASVVVCCNEVAKFILDGTKVDKKYLHTYTYCREHNSTENQQKSIFIIHGAAKRCVMSSCEPKIGNIC